jgi:phthiodiolone/phenolphthiodiolone dimycocerosates ketoreductase
MPTPGHATALCVRLEPIFSGVRDLVSQTIDDQIALSYTAKISASLMKAICFSGTANDVIDQVAEWSDHCLRYPLG